MSGSEARAEAGAGGGETLGRDKASDSRRRWGRAEDGGARLLMVSVDITAEGKMKSSFGWHFRSG